MVDRFDRGRRDSIVLAADDGNDIVGGYHPEHRFYVDDNICMLDADTISDIGFKNSCMPAKPRLGTRGVAEQAETNELTRKSGGKSSSKLTSSRWSIYLQL
jgi:hypothetical protein